MPQSSDEDTLDANAQQNGQNEGQNEQNGHTDSGEKGEKGNKQGGGPVGFWNPALKSVRLEVFKQWLITSMSSLYLLSTTSSNRYLIVNYYPVLILKRFSSGHTFDFHLGNPVFILGRTFQSRGELFGSCRICCGFRWAGHSLHRYYTDRWARNRLSCRKDDCTKGCFRMGVSTRISLRLRPDGSTPSYIR